MIEQLNIFRVVCDEPVLRIGETYPLSFPELERIVSIGASLIWNMQGECRLLPAVLLQDTYRLLQARHDLARIYRAHAIPMSCTFFIRAQTIPMPWLQEGLEDGGQVLHK
jgi:hypothetical protein